MYIKGIGHYLPDRTLLNKDFEKFVETTDQWILERTGIKQRHIAHENQFTSDLATEACLLALKMADVAPSDVEAIILATTTPDSILPQSACVLQHKLGSVKAFCFDLRAACSGFIYGLAVADGLMKAQGLNNVLVVGAETLSRIVNYKDRETCVLFGDGAGAVLLSQTEGNAGNLKSVHLASDGSLSNLLVVKNAYVEMQGKEVFKNAVKSISQCSQIALQKAGLTINEIDWFVPHQANIRILDKVAQDLGVSQARVATSISHTGNTSSASIPITLSEYISSGKISRGEKLLISAFGAGLTSGAAVLEF